MKKTGFIGCGNMGSALVRAMADSGMKSDLLYVFDLDNKKTRELSSKYKLNAADSVEEICKESDILIIAVKQGQISGLFDKKACDLLENKLVVSIAAGITLAFLKNLLSKSRIIRVMPNTPAMIGEGVIAYSTEESCTDTDIADFEEMFSLCGLVYPFKESLMDAVTGLSGSGPAFVFAAINAMAEGGVKKGIPKDVALSMAAKTFLGSAKMVLSTKEHPEVLKDKVTSPGGTTAAGLAVLESAGFRSALIGAVSAAAERSEELGKKI